MRLRRRIGGPAASTLWRSMGRRSRTLLTTALACAALLGLTGAARADTLQAGVGRADITPPTGYYLMGWVRSDSVGNGVNTRLYARAVVLEQNGRKLALVSEDLNGIPGGILAAAAQRLASRGFSQSNILDSASHTHAAPTGFYNASTYDTVFMTDSTPTKFNVTGAIDPQLYAFEVRGLVTAIERADDNLGPARIGWGAERLDGLTQNRSIEAHLANYGIMEAYGTGSPQQDPFGVDNTIDPEVDVLRVDKLLRVPAPAAPSRRTAAAKHRKHRKPRRKHARAAVRRHRRPHRTRRTATVLRWVPVGMWSTFANHGTVNKSTYLFYNGDHHATAQRVVESTIRSQGQVPAGQDVINSYGNSDEGDVTAGIMHSGPADAEWVGDQEAASMLAAWRQAGQNMSQSLPIEVRWTRMCFCGQAAPGGGNVASSAAFGEPQLTGSEEGRGPLYDNTHVAFEGDTSPVNDPTQGDKIVYAEGSQTVDVPKAVPLMAVRIGDRLIVSVPGEPTVGVGQMLRSAVSSAVAGSGITHVVISGLANEYDSYFTTPAEYQRQHYEGGSTLWGRYSSLVVIGMDAELAGDLVHGRDAPQPYPFDATYGLADTAPPFPTGATSATAVSQPAATERLNRAAFTWAGGPKGFDRPIDTPFVTIRRQVGGGWQSYTDDLGLQVRWSIDSNDHYTAEWQVPLDAPAGRYEFLITANHYTLESAPFDVSPNDHLTMSGARDAQGNLAVTLTYPSQQYQSDFTWWPATADGGDVSATVGSSPVNGHTGSGAITVPGSAGQAVTVAPGGARDLYGNAASNGGTF